MSVSVPAFATPAHNDSAYPSSSISKSTEKIIERALQETQLTNHQATVVLTNTQGTETLEVNNLKLSLGEIFEEYKLNIEDYRSGTDEPLDATLKLNSTDELIVFESETSSTSEIIKLPAPQVEEKTDSLYKGETEIKTKGQDGEALKTVVSTTDLSADKTVNPTVTESDREHTSIEEKLVITKAPVAQVTLVGTKERVVAQPAPQPTRQSQAASRNNARPLIADSSLPTKKTKQNTNKEVAELKKAASDETIQLILDQVGKDYVWGANGPNAFDCSGFVRWIYTTNGGKSLPRTAAAQGASSTPVSRADMQPGDIIWSKTHIGIYVGNGKMVHASNPKRGVVMDPVQWYLDKGMKIGRL